jgi:FkbM family methyltransferase
MTAEQQDTRPSALVRYGRSLRLQLRAANGIAGAIQVFRVLLAKRLRRGGADPQAPVGVPMKALAGERLFVRPGTSDLRNASYYYGDHLYLPPPSIAGQPLRQICELGSNMGAALTALAVRYPQARILGVEPDPGNAALAARNVARFGDRCKVEQAGIWDSDVELIVDRASSYGEHGFRVRPRAASDPATTAGIRALKIDSALALHLPSGEIDYMHITIEGTEPRVFAAGGDWAARVRSLRVEAHPELGYPADACIADLEALGYSAWPDERLPEKWIYATRG